MDQQIGSELPPLHNPEQATPAPQNPFEIPHYGGSSEQAGAQNIERGISQPGAPLQQPAASAAPSMAHPFEAAAQQMPMATNTPQIADDTDLIEKEWVVKAKEIVARTKHDPYQQNKEVEQIKADYLKKRYNKDVKIAED